jgi:hypothetical protein
MVTSLEFEATDSGEGPFLEETLFLFLFLCEVSAGSGAGSASMSSAWEARRNVVDPDNGKGTVSEVDL